MAYGLSHAPPNASFIGFSGTPIEQNDAIMRVVGGEYVSVYDIQPAVIDKAAVPIDYENRIAKLGLNEAEFSKVDSDFADVTAGEEEDRKSDFSMFHEGGLALELSWSHLPEELTSACLLCVSVTL